MHKMLSGVAIVNDNIGRRIAYTYCEVDDQGNITKSNIKESFVVLDDDTLKLIEQIENKVKERL